MKGRFPHLLATALAGPPGSLLPALHLDLSGQPLTEVRKEAHRACTREGKKGRRLIFWQGWHAQGCFAVCVALCNVAPPLHTEQNRLD